MKYLVLVFAVCSLFFICGINSVSEAGFSVTQKIENAQDSVMQVGFVAKTVNKIKSWWAAFKKWFNNLPGIRHYNNSIYSEKNWKRTMDETSQDYNVR